MGAILSDNVTLNDVLKYVGINCPQGFEQTTIKELLVNAGGGLKYHLYAWDYANGFAIAYSELPEPKAGDIVYLKADMEGGRITDTNQLKLQYHVVSDINGKIVVAEHPEGGSGYAFERNPDDDYEEVVTSVRGMANISANGLVISQKHTVFKGLNINVE